MLAGRKVGRIQSIRVVPAVSDGSKTGSVEAKPMGHTRRVGSEQRKQSANAVRASPSAADKWSRIWPLLAVVVAGLWTYHNSFAGVFLFDDEPVIVNRPEIRQLWPFAGAN